MENFVPFYVVEPFVGVGVVGWVVHLCVLVHSGELWFWFGFVDGLLMFEGCFGCLVLLCGEGGYGVVVVE